MGRLAWWLSKFQSLFQLRDCFHHRGTRNGPLAGF